MGSNADDMGGTQDRGRGVTVREPITFSYVWNLAAGEEARRSIELSVYGDALREEGRARVEREQRGFARICELIAFQEANEKDILEFLAIKRKKQTDDLEGSGDSAAATRKQKARAR